MLKDKNIGIAVTGSFHKVDDIIIQIKNLIDLGANIHIVISDSINNRSDIVAKLETLNTKIYRTINDVERFGPDKTLDILVVSPMTGNTLSKLANGQTDNAVLMAAKSTLRNNSPILLGVSTNDGLGINGVNLMRLLATKNVYFIPFGQDNPIEKPMSLDADATKLVTAVECALNAKQIQPVIITHERGR